MKKHSFIFCYRNREEHLAITIPRIKAFAQQKNIDHEIIVVEQLDNKPFRRGNLFNTGVLNSSGDIVILHDIDHYPSDNVLYYPEEHDVDVFLPIRRVNFVNNDLSPRPVDKIPEGYRNFHVSVDDDYFGGVISFTKLAYDKINGFCPKFVGWGFEDADLRMRIGHYNLHAARSDDGSFFALDHEDTGLPFQNPELQRNIQVCNNWQTNLSFGMTTQDQTIVSIEQREHVDKWIAVNEFDGPLGTIAVSPFLLSEK